MGLKPGTSWAGNPIRGLADDEGHILGHDLISGINYKIIQ